MLSRAAGCALSCVLFAGCLPPAEQHGVVWQVLEVCPALIDTDVDENTWRGDRVDVVGDSEREFRASFGGVVGDCTEPSDDLRTCSFDVPLVSRGPNGTQTRSCRIVLAIDRDRLAPIGSDPGVATEDVETAGWLALVAHVFPPIVPVIAAFWGLDEAGAFDELFTSPGLGYGMY